MSQSEGQQARFKRIMRADYSPVDRALGLLRESREQSSDPRAAVEAAIKLVWEGENGRAA